MLHLHVGDAPSFADALGQQHDLLLLRGMLLHGLPRQGLDLLEQLHLVPACIQPAAGQEQPDAWPTGSCERDMLPRHLPRQLPGRAMARWEWGALGDEGQGAPRPASPGCAAHAVHVVLAVAGHIVVDDAVDAGDVQPSAGNVCAAIEAAQRLRSRGHSPATGHAASPAAVDTCGNEDVALPPLELVQRADALGLTHLPVDGHSPEAQVAQLQGYPACSADPSVLRPGQAAGSVRGTCAPACAVAGAREDHDCTSCLLRQEMGQVGILQAGAGGVRHKVSATADKSQPKSTLNLNGTNMNCWRSVETVWYLASASTLTGSRRQARCSLATLLVMVAENSCVLRSCATPV